jgi:hypothetical protein
MAVTYKVVYRNIYHFADDRVVKTGIDSKEKAEEDAKRLQGSEADGEGGDRYEAEPE